MSFTESNDTLSNNPQSLELDVIDRWNVFTRLQELAIPCQCAYGQSLQVQVETPTMALQVWSVVRRLTAPREEVAATLENCWNQMSYR